MRPLMGITRDDGKLKPAVIKFYDFTKGGTDIVDQKISKYSCKSVTNKWTMVHFYFLLDTIRCNALTLYAIKHNKSLSQVNSFSNGWELVTSLVKPFIAARPTIGLNLNTRSKMSIKTHVARCRLFLVGLWNRTCQLLMSIPGSGKRSSVAIFVCMIFLGTVKKTKKNALKS